MKESIHNTQLLWNKCIRWFETIGLFLLLGAFGWQCLEEHSNQSKEEAFKYTLYERIHNVWDGIYDEAVHSDRYTGKTLNWVNYDSHNSMFKEWSEVEKEFATLNKQTSICFVIRFILYTLGSILIIVAKWPRKLETE